MGVIYDKDNKRWVNPIDWSGVDRSMLAALAIAPWYFLQAAFGFFVAADPALIPFLDLALLDKVNAYLTFCGFLWLGIFAWAYYLRQTCEHHDLLEWVVILVSIPLVLPVAMVYGILVSSVLPGMVAVSMLGFFLFETRKMKVGVVFNIALVLGLGCLAVLGLVPVTLLYNEVPMVEGSLWWWLGQVMVAMYPLFCGILMTMFFLKGLHAREDKIRELSRKDGLTNIWNRRYLMEIFEHELLVSRRNDKPISFIMIDLDHFKSLNDNYGHKMGDRAIEVAAEVLQKALRTTDSLGRYGGEEFAAILPDCSVASAREVAERCRQAIESTTIEYNDVSVSLTASVGVATISDLSRVNADAIIDRADQALYKSKSGGRNKVSFYYDKVTMNLVNA